jgi:hypothetical protein
MWLIEDLLGIEGERRGRGSSTATVGPADMLSASLLATAASGPRTGVGLHTDEAGGVASRVMARPPSPLTTFIRSLPLDLPVKEVIEQAKAAGHETSESNVSRVRADMAKATPKKPASKPASTSKKAASPKKAASSKNVPAPEETAAPGTAKSAGVSKSEFIRFHPSLSAAEVIAAGKDQGLTFTSSLVYAVRGAQDGKKTTAKKTSAKKTSAKKTSSAPSKKATPKTKATASKTTASSKKTSTPKTGESKADFVRANRSLSANEIAAKAKAEGLTLDANYVYKVRGAAKAAAKQRRVAKKAASTPVVAKTSATSKSIPAPKPVASNGTRPSGSASSVEDLLRAAAAELGLGRAMEILAGERARVRAVMGG